MAEKPKTAKTKGNSTKKPSKTTSSTTKPTTSPKVPPTTVSKSKTTTKKKTSNSTVSNAHGIAGGGTDSHGVRRSTVWGIKPSGFKRMAISYKGTTVNFKVNPKDYNYKRGQRAAVYKTQGANVVQQFGAELAIITITGTTGWHKDSEGLDGQGRFDKLNKLIADYQNDTQNGGHSVEELRFNNYTDNKSYVVTVEQGGFEYKRADNNPLLFNYVLYLIVIGGSDTPPEDTELTAVVGTGSGSSINKGTDATSQVTPEQQRLVDTVTDNHATKQDIKKAKNKLKKKHGK